MKVICDNCGAMYKIPDAKLVKPVNKATCRQCGHRMLIPRPRRGADPDERTLVTAVPPTPPPAPVRSDSGPPTTPIHEVEEKTAPTGSRRTEETRWVRNEVPSPSARPRVQVGSTATSQRPQPTPQAKRTNAFDESDDVATQVGPDPTLTYTPREDEAPAQPAPPPRARLSPAPAPKPRPAELDDVLEDDEDDEPAPSARRKKAKKKKKAAPAHDPRGDMGLALFGVIVALLGVTILGVTSVLDVSMANVGLYAALLSTSAIGLMLAIGGGVGAFLVLATSGRGRKPAWRVASIVIAILLALLIGALPAGGRAAYDVVNSGVGAVNSGFGELLAGVQNPDVPPPVDPVDPGGEADPLEDPAAIAGIDEAEEDTDATDAAAMDEGEDSGTEEDGASDEDAGGSTSTSGTTSRRSSGTTSGTTSRRSSGTSSRRSSGTSSSRSSSGSSGTTSGSGRSSEPDLTDEEELTLPDDLDLGGSDSSSSSSAKSDLPASPPLTAIDVMVKSNTGVKRCFFEYQKAEGSLPKRVDVKFTIKPNGDATSIGTTQRKLEGSELESCLIRSIRSITFPPSQKGTTLTFPFVFG